MRDNQKTKDELLQEVETLRKRVAELTQTEKLLRESEEKWRSLLNNTPDIVMIVDCDGTIRFINHTVPGITIQETIGKKVYDFISSEHHEKMRKDLERIFLTGQSASHEVSGVGRQGALSWYQAEIGPIRQDGRIVAASIVTRDITERRRTEDALRLRNVAIESSINGIAFVDLEGNLFYVNDSFLKLWGYSDEKQVLGKPAVGFWADVSKAAEIREVVNNKGGWTGELVAKRKDGSTFDVELSSSLVKDENANPVCSMASFVDITKSKNAEQSLRESEERLRVALSAAQMGTWRWDPATNQDTRDASFNGILGLEAVESTQPVEDFLQRVHPEDRDMVDGEIQRSLRECRIYIAEFRIVRPDGTVRWLRDQGKPLYGENDNILYLTGAVIDITEHKRMEEALRESEKQFREIFENIAVGVYRTTPDGQILMANPALVHMLGYSSFEEFSQRNLEEEGFEPQYERSTFKEEIEREGRIVSSESTWIRRDGKKLYVIENARAVRDEDGKTLYYEGTAENITKSKQAEEELDMFREKMARAERLASVGTLSAIMAHTLNSPLTAIQLSIQNAIAESKKTPRQSTITKYLKEGLRSVSDVSSTVRGLGKFAAESSKEIISEVNLKVVAERTVKLLSESARRTKMSLHLEGVEELPPIYSNEKDLDQLFFSLVENAIQAADGKNNHQLIISGAVKDKHIQLRFTDDCCGIAPENLDKIFELFFTTNPPGEGTGLGLCIVERIVSGAGGKIRVESKAGKGSTFFVTLPTSRGTRY